VVRTLGAQELAQVQLGSQKIGSLGSHPVMASGFRFVAGFDGTYNDKSHLVDGERQTNVANITDQAQAANNARLKFGYYPGVGTGG